MQRAPAAIYVISHDDIEQSRVTSVPEALRLAPNLLVTQTSSSAFVVSTRGFSGNPNAQNFSNKLLILIDGRSVYTPLYSGIYANTLDAMLEDIDRIEVISGVGATLWGANGMNGVINIITRASYLTQGSFVDLFSAETSSRAISIMARSRTHKLKLTSTRPNSSVRRLGLPSWCILTMLSCSKRLPQVYGIGLFGAVVSGSTVTESRIPQPFYSSRRIVSSPSATSSSKALLP
jgi:hypothetical protein